MASPSGRLGLKFRNHFGKSTSSFQTIVKIHSCIQNTNENEQLRHGRIIHLANPCFALSNCGWWWRCEFSQQLPVWCHCTGVNNLYKPYVYLLRPSVCTFRAKLLRSAKLLLNLSCLALPEIEACLARMANNVASYWLHLHRRKLKANMQGKQKGHTWE